MKTSFLFFLFAIFLSEISATFFWWEIPSDHSQNNLKKCFHKLEELNIDPLNISYCELTDLGTTYEQYYCRINQHTPHPYWQLKMTFLDSKKLEVSVVSTMFPVLITTRYDVCSTHISGVFTLKDEITGGNQRLLAALKMKDGIFIYYMCSYDNWHYNDYHLNTDDKYPGDRSFGRNFGMPDYFRSDWWNWWKVGDWDWDWSSLWTVGDWDNDWFFPRRRHDDHDDDRHDDHDDDRHDDHDRDGHNDGRDCKHKHGDDRHDCKEGHHHDKRGGHDGQNDTHGGHNKTHDDDDEDHEKRRCRHNHDFEKLKKELRCQVKCDHCHYFPVHQFPWWGCRLTLTKKNLRRAANYFNRDMIRSWDFFTWPYYFFN